VIQKHASALYFGADNNRQIKCTRPRDGNLYEEYSTEQNSGTINFDLAGAWRCTNCSEGYYTTKTGSSYCDVCPRGHKCTDASVAPVACPLGTYNDLLEQVECVPCAAGDYTPRDGLTSCEVCPAGHYCLDPAEQPKQCQPGTFSLTKQTTCTPCTAGSYTTQNGSSFCHICPAAHYCSDPTKAAIPCPLGTANNQHGQTECAPCEAGKFSAESGAAVCDVCPAGSYCQDAAVRQKLCRTGTYSGSGQTICTDSAPQELCPAGTANDKLGKVTCDICPPGSYTDFTGAAYCTLCPAGQICPNPAESPTDCPISPFRGATVCVGPDAANTIGKK
ncbi:unnamed protein product, partial [Didymodactylos carnosus]